MSSIFDELRDLFETDDGSLPEIRVRFSDRVAIVAGYALLRARAKGISGHAEFWSVARGELLSLDSVPNAAQLAVSGEAAPFHVVLSGIESRGVELPPLGVRIDPDQIALDYRMGAEWRAAEVEGFFELLADLGHPNPAATLGLEQGFPVDAHARVQRAWRRWASERVR